MAGIDTIHPAYDAAARRWKRCRDAVAGQDAVHDGGEEYLPRLSEQKPAEYRAYVRRTPWYGATSRTMDGLVGMVFRRDPMLDAPAAVQEWQEDVTLSGVALDGFAEHILREVLTTGRGGVLVEYPRVSVPLRNAAEAAAQNLRPYATWYTAESVVNWRAERINNRMQPTMVVLAETRMEQVDEFAAKPIDVRRALLLLEGVYVQQVWERPEDRGEWTMVEQIVPTRGGAPLREIPWFPFGPERLTTDMQDPPLLDLVDLNLSHYRTAADLEHGAHFTGLPMLFMAGVQLDEGEKVMLGSQAAITAREPQARAAYIEFTGQGLGALERLMDRKEGQMAAIGARMLAPEKPGVEAAGTVALRHAGESSVLAALAKLVAVGITEVLTYMAQWAGISGEIRYELNTDYFPATMTAQELTALVGAWQQGAISDQTLFEQLKRGEIIAAERTLEEEQAAIGDRQPLMTGPALAVE